MRLIVSLTLLAVSTSMWLKQVYTCLITCEQIRNDPADTVINAFRSSRVRFRRNFFCSLESKCGIYHMQTLPSDISVLSALSFSEDRASCTNIAFATAMFALVEGGDKKF